MSKLTKSCHLLNLINVDPAIKIDSKYNNINVNGLAHDSRKVEPGFIFGALKGEFADGANFIDSAIERGASVIICDLDVVKQVPDNVCLIKCKDPRRVFSLMASKFYESAIKNISAVTGTNGKTSVVHFCREIWKYLNIHAASIGTIGIEDTIGKVEYDRDNFLTTPDPIKLRTIIQQLEKRGVSHIAMEASSHGLDQSRLDGLHITVGAFTNLSRDHLDYHKSFDNYFKAKMLLFTEVMPKASFAVINSDIEQFEDIKNICIAKEHIIYSYGRANNSYIQIIDIKNNILGQDISFKIGNEIYRVSTSLIGEFQVYNMLCSLAMVLAFGADVNQSVKSLSSLAYVPGRMERVTESSDKIAVFVDYSHTPDALEKALNVLRPYCKGRLVVVFGCGGNRDQGKRPMMGKIAATLADVVVVTDDNPRNEDANKIKEEIISAAPSAHNIGNRRDAIKFAISTMQAGDVLLIAGKGHEKTQIIKDEILPFDDVQVAKEIISEGLK